jgi:hypothetical protein
VLALKAKNHDSYLFNSTPILQAALLRQGSTVDLEAFVIEVDWKQYPSVVTWTLHKPVQQPELEGFAAFAAALDSDDDLEPAVVPSEPRAGKENAEDSIIGHVPSLDDFELLRLVGAGGFGKVYQVLLTFRV